MLPVLPIYGSRNPSSKCPMWILITGMRLRWVPVKVVVLQDMFSIIVSETYYEQFFVVLWSDLHCCTTSVIVMSLTLWQSHMHDMRRWMLARGQEVPPIDFCWASSPVCGFVCRRITVVDSVSSMIFKNYHNLLEMVLFILLCSQDITMFIVASKHYIFGKYL